MTKQDLLIRLKLEDKEIINIYQYGSRVYGTTHKASDWDFIILVNHKTRDQFSDNLVNVFFYTPKEFEKKLNDHEITMLECFFLPDENKWKETLKFSFSVNKAKLRMSLSAKADHSWSKAGKKLTVEKDYDLPVGKKSLFHAMRIITFGCQLADEGSITNYRACNELFNQIWYKYDKWSELYDTYKQQYNELKSKFRIAAPKA